jgi:glucose/arabinose dehydrogenase
VSFTDRDGNSRLWEYAFRNGKADTATRREVLRQDQPYANHNGGQILFGPDGFLYYFFGDGGSGGDPENRAQDLGTWLGKILRIDPRPAGGAPYSVPPDNPFVGREGALPEIWALGLRNPWRNSFDRVTGDLWIGDVGQNTTEEIDVRRNGEAAGANFGWSIFEGTKRFKPSGPDPSSLIAPVLTYPTSEGCAVTGGYLYRGTAIGGLAGAYLFADFCNGRLQVIRVKDDEVVERRDFGAVADQISSFGEDQFGEIYVLSLSDSLYRIVPW